MRYLGCLLLVACSASNDAAIDAAPQRECATFTSAGQDCATDGLASIDLAGSWTLTGTRADLNSSPQPYTRSVTFYLYGPGSCGVSQSLAWPTDEPHGYIDSTFAGDYLAISRPHVGSDAWTVCVRSSDHALAYYQHTMYSMPPQDTVIEGVLTR